ncbi:MAG TPA: YbaB/EbfC family nucleoid-associated protein [Streptosporangiaceae bacterium]|nr:YbaB/EbfC family nucleoid-associated protein [Streptosporangiaceae bacterium]
MLPEWQAHIDELLERYRHKRGQLRDLRRTVDAVSATVTTEDEMIKVTVGPHGRLTGLELNPRVYRRLSPSQLAAAVLAAVGEASSQVDGQVRVALAPLLPDGRDGRVGGADSADGDAGLDLAAILPERPDDLGAFRDRHGLRPGPAVPDGS